MSAKLDEGLQALRNGDTAGAIASLEAAVQLEPRDRQARMYLGAAYGQAGRADDAVASLTMAVELDPSSAQARFNLAVALERTDRPEQAVIELSHALELRPDYPAAREALNRLRMAAAAAPEPVGDPRSSTDLAPEAPEQSSPARPAIAATLGPGPDSASPPAEPAQPPGAPPNPESAEPADLPFDTMARTQPSGDRSYAQPYGTAPADPSPAASVRAQPYGLEAYAGPYVEEPFNLGHAFRDWKRALVSPRRLFQSQERCEGFNGPLATWAAYLVVWGALTLVMIIVHPTVTLNLGGSAAAGGLVLSMGLLTGIVFDGGLALVATGILAAGAHVLGRLFGNRSPYASSFRAVTYSAAPLAVCACILAVVTPLLSQPVTVNPVPPAPSAPSQVAPPPAKSEPLQKTANTVVAIAGVVYGAGFLWAACLLGLGIKRLQGISAGGAFVVVILGLVVPVIILIVCVALVYTALAGALPGGASPGAT